MPEELFFFSFSWWESPPFQWAHVLSAGKLKWGSSLWSYWCKCRWWLGQHTGYSQKAHGTERSHGLKMCVRQNKDDHIRMELNKRVAGGKVSWVLLTDSSSLSDDIFKASWEEHNKVHSWGWTFIFQTKKGVRSGHLKEKHRNSSEKTHTFYSSALLFIVGFKSSGWRKLTFKPDV